MKRLSYYLAFPFLYGISLLPFPLFYLLSDFFCFLLYRVAGYRKKVVMENLRNSFPEKSEEERKRIAARFYRNLADIMLETVKMLTISPESLKKRFQMTNLEFAEKYYAQGRSIAIAVGHFGNWEWACLSQGMASSHPSIVIYKPLSNPWFDRLFFRMRSRTGAVLVSMKQTLRTLVSYRGQSYMAVFAADQTPVQQDAVYWTPFLNQDTAVFLGIEKIAKMNNSVVMFCDMKRVGRGRYTVTYKLLFEDPKATSEYEITKAHVTALEKCIRESPEDWLWSHRRWKVKRTS
ncbi:KDO2-lipid IV(A) lauroyltransferase [Anseongella ginsenosidimutans]|uniref:KDO2-lipid IV(A) lauroyltransferase n=2 Tax=Anseongella ginsenosidimutans TaxID=496056 RepID=A0A4R3KP52_9SPHI|nr:lysophospholipid acyltransferase family protein [Anseongella ginsenosidimutans]QEC53663.1 hypothetical protein FRZ59_15855 [Anseongella ginsenosidimutans]TCS86087.1 KDO2-lipid IV(A) lauroyltransferase [Anseongella ginsenosidimutans]